MFTIEARPHALETLELRDERAGSALVLAPSRGGLATRFTVAGRDVFYLDEATLRDRSKNVRGGNPVLFPQPGKLVGDAFVRGEQRGALLQHGFARTSAWAVVATGTDGAASATLRLVSNAESRAAYPWDFAASYTYSLRGRVLRIDQCITNRSASPMPFGAGFHPYFRVPQQEKAAARLSTTARRAFDNVTKETGALSSIELAQAEVDLHLVDHGALPCALEWSSGALVVRASHEYTHWVIWTLRDKDFVCVEPWTCPGDALNSGDRLLTLAPGATRALWVEYEVLR
jgi:galactose mutarotase-like enzyme